jgi:hypothetical protein
LFAQDKFTKTIVTKWINPNAREFIDAFERRVCWKEGYPEDVISDQGAQIVGEEFIRFCKNKGSFHHTSSPDHQQANGQVEGANKTLKPIVRTKLYYNKLPMKRALEAATNAFNNHLVSSTTGVTPKEFETGYPYVTEMDARIVKHFKLLKKVQKHARIASLSAKDKQKAQYDVGKKENTYESGQLVLVLNPGMKKFGEALWTGPAEVVKRLDNDRYVIFDEEREKARVVNVSHIKKFNIEKDAIKIAPIVVNTTLSLRSGTRDNDDYVDPVQDIPKPNGVKSTKEIVASTPIPPVRHNTRSRAAQATPIYVTPSLARTKTIERPLLEELPKLVLPDAPLSSKNPIEIRKDRLKTGTTVHIYWGEEFTNKPAIYTGNITEVEGTTYKVQYEDSGFKKGEVEETLLDSKTIWSTSKDDTVFAELPGVNQESESDSHST